MSGIAREGIGMDRRMTAADALRQAIAVVQGRRRGGNANLAAGLERELGEMGFTVARDYHRSSAAGEHIDCYHCGRPENLEAFVLPGSPLELHSSEGEAGRWRHWGGSDMWVCRAHPAYMDGDEALSDGWQRTMELHQAVEHLAARDGITAPLHTSEREIERLCDDFVASHAERLATLDAAAPHGGHQGRASRQLKVSDDS